MNELWKCPDGVKHRFRDLRAKNKKAGPPFFFHGRCRRCGALKVQVVEATTDAQGNTVPRVRTYIEAPSEVLELPAGGAVGATPSNQSVSK